MKHFFNDLTKAILDYNTAIKFLINHHLAWVFLVPILLNILLFIGGIALINYFTESIQTSTNSFLNFDDSSFYGAQYVNMLLSGALWLILKIVFFFVFAYTGGYIVLIIMSPVLAYLSEKTEKIVLGKVSHFNLQQLVRDIFRGILIALRNLFLELLVIFIFFILGMIPIVGIVTSLIAPIVLLIVSAYFYGFTFTDYIIERRRLKLKESIQFMKNHRGTLVGNGLPFALILLFPLIGLTLSGFIAIVSVVSAVFSINDISKEQINHSLLKHE